MFINIQAIKQSPQVQNTIKPMINIKEHNFNTKSPKQLFQELNQTNKIIKDSQQKSNPKSRKHSSINI